MRLGPLVSDVAMQGIDQTGKVLGNRYRLERQIGSGGMGAVYEAVHLELGKRVAVKVVHQLDGDLIERFKREARVLASLNHVNIVEILDFSAEPPAYLAMELLNGRTLGQIMRSEGAFAPERMARIALQVLDALHETHAHDLVHRDIKPDNIFLSPSSGLGEIVKLVDFGIARSQNPTGPLTYGAAMIGTIPYMSPEQATGLTIDGRVDVYALGVCMYYACSMKRPYTGETGQELLLAILKSTARPLEQAVPGLDSQFAAIVHRAFARDITQRFQSARAMSEALRAWLDSQIRPGAPGLPNSVRPPMSQQHGVSRATAVTSNVPQSSPSPGVSSVQLPGTVPKTATMAIPSFAPSSLRTSELPGYSAPPPTPVYSSNGPAPRASASAGPSTLHSALPSTLRSNTPPPYNAPAPYNTPAVQAGASVPPHTPHSNAPAYALTPGSGVAPAHLATAQAPSRRSARVAGAIAFGLVAFVALGAGGVYLATQNDEAVGPVAISVAVSVATLTSPSSLPTAAVSLAGITTSTAAGALAIPSEKQKGTLPVPKTPIQPTPAVPVTPPPPSSSVSPSHKACQIASDCPAPYTCLDRGCTSCEELSKGTAYKLEYCNGKCAVLDNKLNCGGCGLQCLGSDRCVNPEV
jgi:eukaryotic-like serine/threonine-protein kinase